MEPGYISALAALAGSAIGGLTSLTASWLSHRLQAGAQERAHDLSRREELYRDFIEDASQAYADALAHSEVDVAKIVRLYALVSRMRTVSSQAVVAQAELVMRRVLETYGGPNRTIRDEAEAIQTGGLDPLVGFGGACREELTAAGRRHLTSR
jgi:hypothetical protein